MKVWWQQLSIKEQKLVGIMGAVILFFILYSVIWQPLNDSLITTKSKIDRQQKLLSWVNENIERYQQIKSTSSIRASKDSLSSIVNRTAGKNKISIARMLPQGEDLQVWIDKVSFNQLLQWLEILSINEGLKVINIDLISAEQAGVVRVRRLQLGRN